jgi:hypothetical protein
MMAADETALDQHLAAAREDGSQADAYYELLLQSELFVPVWSAKVSPDAQGRSQDGDSFAPVVIEMEGRRIVPLFDTQARLATWAEREIEFIALAGQILFEILDPAFEFVLNPGTDHVKVFSVEERAWIRANLLENDDG